MIIHPVRSHWTRDKMPQIDDVASFLASLESLGIRHHKETVSAKSLHPTQNELNLTLVFSLIDAGLDTAKFPVIVASDGHILDGHNRWYAADVAMLPVHIIRVELGIGALLHHALSMPNISHTTVNYVNEVQHA